MVGVPVWRKLSTRARLVCACLALLALVVSVPTSEALRREFGRPSEVVAMERPLSEFFQAACPESHLEVLETKPLRVVGTVNCSPERRTELEDLLRDLCPIDANRGDSLVLVTGRVPFQLDLMTQLALLSVLGIVPALLALQLVACWLVRIAVPCLRFSPAVVLAGILCLGWPLWALVPSLLVLLALLPRPTRYRPIQNGLEEAAVWLMSMPPEFSAQCFKSLGPDAVYEITLAISKLPPVTPARRAQVLATFAASAERTRQRLGVKKATGPVDPDLASRTITDWYVPASTKVATPPKPAQGSGATRARRKIYSCPVCDEVFIDEESLRRHEWVAHQKVTGTQPEPEPQPQPQVPPAESGKGISRVLFVLGLCLIGLAILGSSARSYCWLTLPNAPYRPNSDEHQRMLSQFTHLSNIDSLVLLQGRRLTVVGVRGVELAQLQPLAAADVRLLQLPARTWPASSWLKLGLGLGLLGGAAFLSRRARPALAAPVPAAAPAPAPAPAGPPPRAVESLERLMEVDGLGVHLGRSLLCLADSAQGGKLQERVVSIRRHIGLELGLVVPRVKFRDNLALPAHEYTILVRDCVVARGTIRPDQFLAIGPLEKLGALPGAVVQDPTYGMSGKWIAPHCRGDAERLGCMIFDPISVLATHMTEIVRKHADELLGLAEVCRGLQADKLHPLAQEIAPHGADNIVVWKVMRLLLQEGVSVRDQVAILESIAEQVHLTCDPGLLAEFARAKLARPLSQELANQSGTINVITLDPACELRLEQCLRDEAIDPDEGLKIVQAIGVQVTLLQERGLQPVLLLSPWLRPRVRKLAHRSFPHLKFLSWNDIAPDFKVNSVASVVLDE